MEGCISAWRSFNYDEDDEEDDDEDDEEDDDEDDEEDDDEDDEEDDEKDDDWNIQTKYPRNVKKADGECCYLHELH